MKLLLISNSTNAGEEYLKYPLNEIKKFLGEVKTMTFIPYAGVTISYEEYVSKVTERLAEIGVAVESVHTASNPREMLMGAESICVGGGNTFALTKRMQEEGCIEAIVERVRAGIPYIGWSAGSNVTAPTICTTNDMPIVEPKSFNAMGLVPFQINPHYLDANPEGHAGETREQRIMEYTRANPGKYVVGLREGCMLHFEGGELKLIGSLPMRIFKEGVEPYEVKAGADLSFLL